MSTRGLCITIEGIDGSGKSTFARNLSQAVRFLTQAEVTLTREPGGTEVGERLRDILKSGAVKDEWTQALLFAAARRELVETVITPAVRMGQVIIIDRFVDSMLVYQSSKTLSQNELLRLHELTTGGYLPDLTFWVDTPAALARSRVESRSGNDALDQADLERYFKLQEGFRNLYLNDQHGRIIRLDGELTESNIVSQAIGHLAKLKLFKRTDLEPSEAIQ